MKNKYIIITPAYNEEKNIVWPIESVIRQTILPSKWIIVDDNSNDNTAQVIKKYEKKHPGIIQYHKRTEKKQTYFASNVHAIMEGYQIVKKFDFNFLAILDADITLPSTYYEEIIDKLNYDPNIGIASGVYFNLVNGKLEPVLNDRRSTPKAIMVFRRETFDQINGFLPLPYGGEDTAACIMARINGWKTWSFPDIKTIHHRPTGTGITKSILHSKFHQGICEHGLATHPIFMFLKSIRRCIKEKPFFLGGLIRMAGFIYAYIKQIERKLPSGVVKRIRKEQLYRMYHGNKIPEEMMVNDKRND